MDYLMLLFNQFNNAKGYKEVYLNSNQYLNEFAVWLHELSKQSKCYLDFSLFNGINLADGDFIEINKGKYDTLIKGKKIISSFANTLNQLKQDLVVYQGEPLIRCGSKIKKGQVVDTYCTHNPYNMFYFNNLEQLHNNGYMICFGIFGKNCDRDKQIKIKFIQQVMQNMIDDFIFDYEIIDNNYYYIVFTKRLVEEKVLKR